MSENTAMQIIDAIEYKFGIVLDFAKENVIPYAIDLANRYQKYFIFQHSFEIGLLVILLILFGLMFYFSSKKIHEGTRMNLYDVLQVVSIFAIIALTMISIIYIPIAITNIIKAIYVPEFLILELIGGR